MDTEKSASPTLILAVDLDARDGSAPLRVLSLLARRQCRVRSAAYAIGEGGRATTLRVELVPPPRGAATVQRWVAGLVSVHAVTRERP